MKHTLTFSRPPAEHGQEARATPGSLPFRLPVAPDPLRLDPLRPDDAAIEGARGAELTALQRRRLAVAARRAYDTQAGLGLVAEGETFDAWRHARVRETTGRGGLRELAQRDYGRMMARFIELAGGSARRGDWRAAAKPAARDDADRARGALRAECAAQAGAFGGAAQAEAYAAALLERIHRRTWQDATARQLWQVLFTVRNRARAKNRRKCPGTASGPEPVPTPGRAAGTHSRAFAGGSGPSCGGGAGETGAGTANGRESTLKKGRD